MRLLQRIRFALGQFFRPGKFEADLHDEVADFVAREAAQREASGETASEAARKARVEMAGIEQTKERVRGMRPGVWLETLWQDVRFAARMLRKNPGYAAVALVTMALGIGANTAIFSVVNAALLQPLPYRNAEQLVLLQTERGAEGRLPQVAFLDYQDIRAQHSGIENAAAILLDEFITGGDEQPARRFGLRVTPSFFSTLGVLPALGRAFTEEEAIAGKDRVAILSHGLWKEAYAGDRNVLGKTVVLDGERHTIVGVMPEKFDFFLPMTDTFVIQDTDIYVPLGPGHPLAQRRSIFTMEVVARLRAGVSRARAEAELAQISRGLAEKYPDTNSERTIVMTPLREQVVGGLRAALYLLMAAVGAVLLVACANLANLMVGRMAAREQELAVRAALGASRGRLVRQLLAESTLLVATGGALGVLLAWRLMPQFTAMLESRFGGAEKIQLDVTAVVYAVLLSAIAGVASGVLPARSLWHGRREEVLHGAGRSTSGAGRSRTRKILVVAEIALSCVLLAGAALLGGSLLALLRVPLGFDPANMVTFQVTLSSSRYQTRAQVAQSLENLKQELERLPGVTRATVSGSLPLSGHNTGTAVFIEGRMPPVGQQPPTSRWQYVQPGYFAAMGIPLVKGRDFEGRDIERNPHVTVISEAAARRDFPGENPIGKGVAYGPPGASPDWHEIIGVVGDVRHGGLREEPAPRVYDLLGQHGGLSVFGIVRSERDAAQMMPGARAAMAKIDPGAPIYSVRTMQQWMARSANRERTLATLLGVFAGVALFLAAVGAYGVIATLVAQRTREIGIRMALGAEPRTILRATVWEGAQLALIGLGLGVAASLALGPLVRGLLFGIGAADPGMFAAVAAVMLVVALAAFYIPARRAARIDPIIALRQE